MEMKVYSHVVETTPNEVLCHNRTAGKLYCNACADVTGSKLGVIFVAVAAPRRSES